MVVGLVSMGVPKGAARHMYWYSSWSLEDIWRGGGGHGKVLQSCPCWSQLVYTPIPGPI